MLDRMKKASDEGARAAYEEHARNLRGMISKGSVQEAQANLDATNAHKEMKPFRQIQEASDPNQHQGTLEAVHDTLSHLGQGRGYVVSHPEGTHHRVEYSGPGTTAQVAMHFAQMLADHGAYDSTSVRYGPDHHMIHFYDGNVPGYARVQRHGDKHIVDFCRAVD